MSTMYRVYNDDGSIRIQSKILEDCLGVAVQRTILDRDTEESIWLGDPEYDAIKDDGIGIINPFEILVANVFQGKIYFELSCGHTINDQGLIEYGE